MPADHRTDLEETMKEISSPLTYFYKFIFPLIWAIGFPAGVHEVLLAGPSDPRWSKYLVVWILFTLFLIFSCGHIKKVTISGRTIRISNFRRTIEIESAEVESVDGSSFLSPRLVWFNLKQPCGFGRKIAFIPAFRKARGIGKHPLVEELAREFGL